MERQNKRKENSRCEKVKYIISNVSVEPVVFLTFLSSKIYQLVTQNLYIEKACRVSLELSTATCDAMARRDRTGYALIDEVTVQKLTAKMLGVKSIFQGSFPLFLSIFVGSWSDRHSRRKPVILLPVVGEFLSCICLIFNTIFFYELPLIITALCDALPMSMLGGWTCLFIGVFSYVGTVSSKENRSVRIAGVTTSLNVGLCLGVSLSGILFEYIGFIPTYSLCAVMISIAFACGYFLIHDVPLKKEEEEKKRGTIKPREGAIMDFFDLRYFITTLKVCFRSRKDKKRLKMIIILLLTVVVNGPQNGEATVSYLYTRYKFGWRSLEFSANYLLQSVIHLISNIVAMMMFTKYLRWEDETLGIVAMISSIAGNLVFAFASQENLYIAGAVVDCFSSTAHMAVRSLMPKIVPINELGQAYSVAGIVDALTPLVFCSIYTYLYKTTIEVFPGTFYLFSVVIKIIGFFLFAYLYKIINEDKPAEEIKVENFTLLVATPKEFNDDNLECC